MAEPKKEKKPKKPVRAPALQELALNNLIS